ncbi:TPA: NAD-dependent malic enzyme [Salmonella enterica]|nr:NAD-dependent malic enzyme [Salmonella enterica]EBZ4888475.1 NAD-dependent malic enzyme [Salmonella enterica subsp. enterica serovar Bredeney]EDR9399075.1 NAD-dependent malic enzyme [Salmonella enterica subsp. enterica]EDT6893044.1 NAD-dependent malic enzyme [Salmonella enterica subsp. enterica serovar Javiana]EDX5193426.1 NAD-dependent malic enzyme [Salmonella enterica subsp. enterica serovar Glostrup]EHW1129029.1 NAD-dependent malic enzyme [Salmonella enterica subsp. enterica serovar Kino
MSKYIHLSGLSLINNALLNKGTAFSASERCAFNLNGLLPDRIESLEEQVHRVKLQLDRFTADDARYVFLRNLQDTNETLFYKFIISHLEETLPLIYTPTVGYACQHYSEIWRKPRGICVAWEDRDDIDTLLRNVPSDNIRIIVVTDGERILGLGDLGIGGMGIPVGKLSLYSACGGIDPQLCLPVILDVGTDNELLLDSPVYMGARHPRISDSEYYPFLERFIVAVEKRWPGVLLQFEDFALRHATPLLKKYQDRLCCFNDDIQGTAAVTLGTLQSACRHKKQALSSQTLLFVGAGSAGCGIADLIVSAMMAEGLNEQEARHHIYMVDKNGLLLKDNQALTDFQSPFAWSAEKLGFSPENKGLEALIAEIKPSVLIGVSGVPGLFTEQAIRQMYAHCEKPIIFPLSNPTSRAEAVPADLLSWTEGKAIVATGSPFTPVEYNGEQRAISQCNNAYIFPGIGLGVLISDATRVTRNMLLASARALASFECKAQGLLPDIRHIHDISRSIAFSVALAAMMDNVAPSQTLSALTEKMENTFWYPEYTDYHRISL